MTEEAKQDYIQKYCNPGLRTLAKFLFDEFLFNNMSVPFDNTSVPFFDEFLFDNMSVAIS